MEMKRTHRRWIWLAAAVMAMGAFVALNWQTLALSAAFALAERRPALLVDAEWNEPASARKFLNRFPPGTNESELLKWLGANKFDIDLDARRADRRISGLPCNEIVKIKWSTGPNSTIDNLDVRVSEAGCL
ncbi:MAG: hypothetical protein AAF936_08890 [Pseudomonadota bacterium]